MSVFLEKIDTIQNVQKYPELEGVLGKYKNGVMGLGAGGLSLSVLFSLGAVKGILRRKRKGVKINYLPAVVVFISGYGVISGFRWFWEREITKEVLNIVEVDDEVLDLLQKDNEIHMDYLKGNLFK